MKSRLLLLLVCLVFMPGLAVALNVSGIVTDEANRWGFSDMQGDICGYGDRYIWPFHS